MRNKVRNNFFKFIRKIEKIKENNFSFSILHLRSIFVTTHSTHEHAT